MTCRALASYLKENVLDEKRGEILEAAAIKSVAVAIHTNLTSADAELFISELPNILKLNYPEVKNILKDSLEIISQVKATIQAQINFETKMLLWKDFKEYDNIFRILQAFECYKNV